MIRQVRLVILTNVAAVLLLYLRNYLGFDDDLATAVYHAFTVLAYFTPVIGAIIADSYWGKFKVLLYYA